ncbi:Coiled-coil-helix-coiled-coil-helix domain-containing protein [Nesidiocoris tenuis]|uniref:Coiled-coil-helix-coiled-coil-helix domain-containing protein n=1 Tax=Nesidiocoris tenuis TaxID=355587 RepID=A0ABN7AQB3_9HEMI|nr:Coiled-coil-helix-coiled-coil-helix domain-containing protein [Nesidiocoris tenuis]
MSRSRGSSGSRSSGSSRSYSAAPARKAPVPAPAPKNEITRTRETVIIREGSRRQPGLFGQMAATAGGVAVGSAVGHAVGEKIVGGGRGSEQSSSEAQRPQEGPCEWEIKKFLECAQNNDVSLCEGFNEAIKACKAKYGLK